MISNLTVVNFWHFHRLHLEFSFKLICENLQKIFLVSFFVIDAQRLFNQFIVNPSDRLHVKQICRLNSFEVLYDHICLSLRSGKSVKFRKLYFQKKLYSVIFSVVIFGLNWVYYNQEIKTMRDPS